MFLKTCVPRSVNFESMRIAIDCANGAGYKVGPDVLEELGADVVAIGVDPNGININDGCGAVHLAGFAKPCCASDVTSASRSTATAIA